MRKKTRSSATKLVIINWFYSLFKNESQHSYSIPGAETLSIWVHNGCASRISELWSGPGYCLWLICHQQCTIRYNKICPVPQSSADLKMCRKASEFLLVFIVLCNVVDTVDICQKSTLYDYTMGKKLPGFPIKIFENIGPQSCFRECQAHGNCASVNYNRSEFSCQLMNDRKSESKPLSDDGNFFYLEMKDTVSIFL